MEGGGSLMDKFWEILMILPLFIKGVIAGSWDTLMIFPMFIWKLIAGVWKMLMAIPLFIQSIAIGVWEKLKAFPVFVMDGIGEKLNDFWLLVRNQLEGISEKLMALPLLIQSLMDGVEEKMKEMLSLLYSYNWNLVEILDDLIPREIRTSDFYQTYREVLPLALFTTSIMFIVLILCCWKPIISCFVSGLRWIICCFVSELQRIIRFSVSGFRSILECFSSGCRSLSWFLQTCVTRNMKTMKAPGMDECLISRLHFEADPRTYFQILRGKMPIAGSRFEFHKLV